MRALLPISLLVAVPLAILSPAAAGAAAGGTPPLLPWMGGHALGSPTGLPLFPRLAGLPMPGWLAAVGRSAMDPAYEGYHQRLDLPDGTHAVLLRSEGFLGLYLERGGRCIGDLVGEPIELTAPEDAEARLERAGFTHRARFVATRAGDFALDARVYERVSHGYLERYVFTLHPPIAGLSTEPHPILSIAGYFPSRLRGPVDALAPEVDAGVADFFARRERGTPPAP